MLTNRQRSILRTVQADIKAKRNWTDRVLTPNAEISWDEMLWVGAILAEASLVRIDAMFTVDNIIRRVHA